ncbi:MAG: hypothetical protein JXO51_01435 [Candidatus Aminicenantes bacterium]|nr:hypothetical protein [Candidatus Aminicenantes bacterium]
MRKTKYWLLGLSGLLLFHSMLGQAADPEPKFTVSQLQEDFLTLRKLIEENHPTLYRYHNKAFFRNHCNGIQALIDREMTELEFIKILEPMVAKIHCGHTELWYSQKFTDHVYADKPFIPFSVYYIRGQAYVRREYVPCGSLPEGSEIIAINDEPVAAILKKLFSRMNGDGYNTQNILFTINQSPVSVLAEYFDYAQSYKIKFVSPGESTPAERVLAGIKYKELTAIADQRYPDDSEEAKFSFKIMDKPNAAVMAIRSFAIGKEDDFAGFLKSSFQQVNSRNVQNLIVDVRGNDGGHPDHAIELLKYLMDGNFTYFATHVSRSEWNEPIKPHKDRYRGQTFVLIDGGELSTTGHFISLLRYHRIGKFIGQESGSTFTCNDNSLEFTLPNTRIRGKVARTTFATAVEGMDRDRGIMPDHYVEPKIKDIIEGKDTILEYALELICRQAGQ